MAIETRLFGRTGVNVSNLCLGAMMFGMRTEPEESYAMVDRAIERGVNFIDTANVYSRGRSEDHYRGGVEAQRQTRPGGIGDQVSRRHGGRRSEHARRQPSAHHRRVRREP